MITFKEYLVTESKEVVVKQMRPLTNSEVRIAKEAIKLISNIHDFLLLDSPSIEHIKKFSKQISDAKKYFPFVDQIENDLDKIIKSDENMKGRKQKIKDNRDLLKSLSGDIANMFRNKDFSQAKEKSQKVKDVLDIVDHHVDASKEAKRLAHNKFKSEPSIFGTTRLLPIIDNKHYEKIRSLDTNSTLYSAIDFPSSKADNFDFVFYYLLNLSNDPKPQRVSDKQDFRTYTKVKYANSDSYKKLSRLIDDYLHYNNKDLVPRILELISAIPEINLANNKAKRKIKKVFRGLAFDDYTSEKEIKEQELKQRYVATSEQYYVAKNFALRKGHLESADSRRTKHGVILTYEVDAGSIVFDTKIVDTVYNESEVLIDTSKAKLVDIESV